MDLLTTPAAVRSALLTRCFFLLSSCFIAVVQYTVSSPLGAAEQKSPAVLTAPFRYFVALAESAPRGMRSSWKSNRPPTINVPLKTRADFLSVAVPPGSMDGECAVRSSGDKEETRSQWERKKMKKVGEREGRGRGEQLEKNGLIGLEQKGGKG